MSRHPRQQVACADLWDAVRRKGLSNPEVARCCGWSRTVPDSQRVRRVLGERVGKMQQDYVTFEVAEHLCRCLDIDPVDVGL